MVGPARRRLVDGRDGRRAGRPGLTWGSFLYDNLLPVTIGDVIGGAVMVGAVYWFVHLRQRGSE